MNKTKWDDQVDLKSLASFDGRRTAHEMTRETLRRAIQRGVLRGGMELNQASIARQLGVSITPVREALRDLTTEGLVHFDAWKSVTVHQVTESELEEVYELRAVLEALAIERACARVAPEDVVKMRRLVEDMRAQTDPALWVEMNEMFHQMIVEIGGSARLGQVLVGLRGVVSLYVGLSIVESAERRKASDDEHLALIDALELRDVVTATSISHHHMDRTRETHAHINEKIPSR